MEELVKATAVSIGAQEAEAAEEEQEPIAATEEAVVEEIIAEEIVPEGLLEIVLQPTAFQSSFLLSTFHLLAICQKISNCFQFSIADSW